MHASYNEEDAHAGSKRKSKFDTETVQMLTVRLPRASQSKNCFKMHHLTNKSSATLHTLLASQPLRNEVSMAVRPE